MQNVSELQLIILMEKKRDVDVNEMIKVINLQDDTKRIVQRTKYKTVKC